MRQADRCRPARAHTRCTPIPERVESSPASARPERPPPHRGAEPSSGSQGRHRQRTVSYRQSSPLRHPRADDTPAADVLSSRPMTEQQARREFKAGDGSWILSPDEHVVLDFKCSECGVDASTVIVGTSIPSSLDCDKPRQCQPCEKKPWIQKLRQLECSISDDRLREMHINELMSLVVTLGGRT